MTKTVLHLPASAEGPRGVRTEKHGDVMLQPGEVREDLTLTDDELELAKTNELKSGKPKKSESAAKLEAEASDAEGEAAEAREKADRAAATATQTATAEQRRNPSNAPEPKKS